MPCLKLTHLFTQGSIYDLPFGEEVLVKDHELPRGVRGHTPGNFLK